MSDKPLDPQADPFHPPEIPTEVECIHCGRQYDSYLIEWREFTSPEGKLQGFWCCPTPGCDGLGFGFDILPTDPHYQDERGGWIQDDDDEEEGDEDWEEGEDEDWGDPEDTEHLDDFRQFPDSGNNRNGSGPHNTDDDIPY
jgi:hypothetical protein